MRANHRRAFTLLELIISIAVLGSVMAIVTQSLDSASRLNDRVTRQADINGRANDIINKLSLQLRQASDGTSSVMDLNGSFPSGYTTANAALPLNAKSYKFKLSKGVVGSNPSPVYFKTWTEEYETNVREIIYDYSTDPGRLVLKSPGTGGATVQETLSENVSANGFNLVRVGNTLQMSLSLRSTTRVNEDIVYTAQAQTLFLRATLNSSSGSCPVTNVYLATDADGVMAGTTTTSPTIMFGDLVSLVNQSPTEQQMTMFITAPIGQKIDPATIVVQIGNVSTAPVTVAEGATVSVAGATVRRTTYPAASTWPSRNGTYSVTLTGSIPSSVYVTATAANQAGISVTEQKYFK